MRINNYYGVSDRFRIAYLEAGSSIYHASRPSIRHQLLVLAIFRPITHFQISFSSMSYFRSPILDYFPIRAGGDVLPVPGGPPPPTGVDLFMRFALAGAIGTSITHGALTPVDVVKTRIQLEPEVYNKVCISLVSTGCIPLCMTLCRNERVRLTVFLPREW